MKKRSSLFYRLMLSVALPEIIIFVFVAVVAYFQLKDLFTVISKEKIENLQDELISIIRFQDVSLAQMSRSIDHSAQNKMKQLRFDYFKTSDSIESADLHRIREEIGMMESDAIYIINKSGKIVNTTFKRDLGLDLFAIDHELKELLETIFTHEFYVPQPMTLETSTRKFKKYIYQRSLDGQYIIQLGFYSHEVERFNAEIGNRFAEIEKGPNHIDSIDLILAPWNPFSLYSLQNINQKEVPLIREIFTNKQDVTLKTENQIISYTFFDQSTSDAIQWTGILKVVYDRERDRKIMASSMMHKITLFGFGMILLLVILYINVRMVTKPVSELAHTVKKLGDGDLSKRMVPNGSKEIYYLSMAFNQMAENLESQHKEITKKNEEILSSINYAKRIQEAILPEETEVQSHLKDSFIFYKPKDIVAGDFFWLYVDGDSVYIAAADCTGHGVPGAMVSVVCSNALNRAVKELGITEPAKILDKVRDIVIETFDKSHHNVKDGMDICFCKINVKTRTVQYAGAQNSLYRVTKIKEKIEDPKIVLNDHNMLLEYKADKQPIGKFTLIKPFTQYEIVCEKNDCIYLFTDGYPDQFGGPEGKKFMYKSFKKLLLSLHNDDPEEQKLTLDRTFTAWKGHEGQIDDVCIIGIKL